LKEISLVLIKPDAVLDKREKEIIGFLETSRMKILHLKYIWCNTTTLKNIYPHVILKESISTMMTNFCKGSAMVAVFEGDNALAVGLETKRIFRTKYYYGYYGCTIHASDNEKEFERELKILLPNFLIETRGSSN